MKKSQIAMEFIMIVSLVFLVFIGFLAMMYNQFSDLNERKDYSTMFNLANLIKNEVLISSKVHDNYIRRFEIPFTVNGNGYKIDLEKDVLVITNEDNLSTTIILPVEVKGGFIEKNKKGQMEHCITKNKHDGVRISRNQASIELEEDAFLKDRDGDGILDIPAGDEFYSYVRLNCLDNIQTVGFSLELTNLDYEIGSYELLYQYDEFGVFQDFINPFFYNQPNEASVLEQWSPPKLTFSIPQKSGQASSGSGNIVKLWLKALSPGTAKIEFVPDKIFLIDNTATYLTEEALPSSDIPVEIEII